MKSLSQRLAHWIQRQRPEPEDRWILQHDSYVSTTCLAQWDAKEASDALTLGRDIASAAQDDCDARAQPASFRLALRRGSEEIASHPIRLEPIVRSEIESADPAGFMAQLMRHNELLTRMHVQSQGTTLLQRDRMIEMLLHRLGTLEGQRTETLALERDAMITLTQPDAPPDEESEARRRREAKLDKLMEMLFAHYGPKLLGLLDAPPSEPAAAS